MAAKKSPPRNCSLFFLQPPAPTGFGPNPRVSPTGTMAAAAAATLAASVLFRRSASLLLSANTVRRSSLRSLSSDNPKFRAFASALTQADPVCAAPVPAIDGFLEYTRLLPCPQQSSPPRVEHLVVSEGGTVLDFICKALNLPPLYVADLIQFGAVHYALVCPSPPPTATSEQLRIFKEVTAPSVLRKRASIKGKTVREAQKTFRITDSRQFVEAGMYLRVHVHPKRFPRCYVIDWKSRIIAVADSYVVLDKPAGTSVGGTTDNLEESCATFATRALGLVEPLKTTHQIDNCSEGCVVLARTKEYCSVFHGMIREKQVKKLYLALAVAPVPIGILTHYMRPINMAPRLVSEEPIKGWHLCKMDVLECKRVPWPCVTTEEKYFVEDGGWPRSEYAYECKINLLTGRTHQIRTQLAACGSPIIGDSAYMPAALVEMENPGTNPFGRSRRSSNNDIDKELATAEWLAVHGKEPTVAIGLQACQISWDEGKHIYEARTPWWRSECCLNVTNTKVKNHKQEDLSSLNW